MPCSQRLKTRLNCFQVENKRGAGATRATSNSTADKSKSQSTAAKTPAKAEPKTATKTAPPRGIPAPAIKPAAVVVPKMSVVGTSGEAPATVAAAAKAGGDEPHMLKKQEFVERVVKASGAKKKDVKLILDAALGVLGDALSASEELNLPPLGKAKVNKQRQEGNAEVLILKLRRGGGSGGGGDAAAEKEGLAEDGEDD